MLQLVIFSINERNLNWLLPQCNQLFLLLKDWDPVQQWGKGLQARSKGVAVTGSEKCCYFMRWPEVRSVAISLRKKE